MNMHLCLFNTPLATMSCFLQSLSMKLLNSSAAVASIMSNLSPTPKEMVHNMLPTTVLPNQASVLA